MMRRCHYEVLCVERDATDAILKKAYRKLALKWHPDKNLDNVEESTEVFSEIQQAYDILIDPQERAWYDKHREQILRGGDDYVDNSLNLMKYFSPSAYSGFGDDKNGFYSVYSWVFKTVAEEDAEFAEENEEFLEEVPEFGKSDGDYEDSATYFYAYWQSYCTKKSYVWHEKYDIREAPNRRTLRLMEKENKKLRDAGKRDRNEEVRALVKFVKKRDKRVKLYMERLKVKEDERKQMTEIKKLEAKKEREKMFQEYESQEWASMSGLERDLAEMDGHLDSEFGRADDVMGSQSEDEEEEYFYCVACDKAFKSNKALMNHEKSRKHKDNVQLIKRELEQMENQDGSSADVERKFLADRQLSMDAVDPSAGKQKEREFVSIGELELTDSLDLNELRIKTTNRYKVKEKHYKGRKLSGIGEFDESLENETGDQEIENANTGGMDGERQDDGSVEKYGRLQRQERVQSSGGEDCDVPEGLKTTIVEHSTNTDSEPTEKIENNEVATKAEESTLSESKPAQGFNSDKPSVAEYVCNVCKTALESRNKLFQHIKEQGHALRIDADNEEAGRTGRKKKGKKKR